jgi:hypothetical protein
MPNENGRTANGWIATFTGRKFWPCDPQPEDICIEDVAHALSMLCRYTGHVREFYSVAQHSYMVSQIVPLEDAKWGLLHDASEAYLNDISRPVKPALSNYRELEETLMKMVAERFGLPWPIPDSIHHADKVMLATERRDLLPCPADHHWTVIEGIDPLPEELWGWGPRQGEIELMVLYNKLFH